MYVYGKALCLPDGSKVKKKKRKVQWVARDFDDNVGLPTQMMCVVSVSSLVASKSGQFKPSFEKEVRHKHAHKELITAVMWLPPAASWSPLLFY